jgi:hypothetical protein
LENVDEIGEMYMKLTFKCSDWKEKFKKHNMGYYTLTNQKDTVPSFWEPVYVDPYGYADFTPPDASNNYYDSFPIRLQKPSSHTKCTFLGHSHRCPSPKKRTHKANSIETFYPYGMHAKLKKDEQKQKAKSVRHEHECKIYDEDFHRAARTRSEQIFKSTWQEKDRIRQTRNVPFTRIERAFMASAISVTTAEELEKDAAKAILTAEELSSEMKQIDVNKLLNAQQAKMDLLLKELEEFRRDHQSVNSHHSNAAADPPKLINTAINSSGLASTTPAHGEISYTMTALLDKYDTLDEESKNELLRYAISTGNENLQSRLLMLCQADTTCNTGTEAKTLANLT